jgi:hypothetical protein
MWGKARRRRWEFFRFHLGLIGVTAAMMWHTGGLLQMDNVMVFAYILFLIPSCDYSLNNYFRD